MPSYHRRSYRLRGYNYALPNPYYVTLCTFNRRKLFGELRAGEMHLNEIGRIVDYEWKGTENKRSEVVLDEYVIMPNHVHLIVWILLTPNETSALKSSLVSWEECKPQTILPSDIPINQIIIDPSYVRYFGKPVPRSLSSIIGAFKSAVSRQVRICFPEACPIWQSRFYDHIIRDRTDLQRIRKYIRANPMRWELDWEKGIEEDNNGWQRE